MPEYVDQKLTPLQAADRLATYFSTVSQTVEPLDETQFHPALKLELEQGRKSQTKPTISQHQVYCKMLRATKPHSAVP